MADPRTELAAVNRHLGWWQHTHGEIVLWYELSGKESRYDDVFNVRNKVYNEPIAVPVLWVISTEDVQETSPEGRRNVTTLQMAVAMWQFKRVGISDPYDFERHLNDLCVYQGEYFSIGEYSLLGRLWRDDVILGINAIHVYPEEELVGSEVPDSAFVAEAARPSRGVNVTAQPTYLHYPPPAPQAVATGTITGSYGWSKAP
jgi:hypothetical protein